MGCSLHILCAIHVVLQWPTTCTNNTQTIHTSLASPACCKVRGLEDKSSIVNGLPGELPLIDGTGLERKFLTYILSTVGITADYV